MLRARLLDLALAAGCVLAAQFELRHHGGDGVTGGPTWLNVAVLLVLGLLVAGWRVAPGPTLVAMSVTMFLPSLVTVHAAFFWTTILPFLLVVFRNARSGDGWLASWGWPIPVVALASDAMHTGEVVSNAATVVIVFGGGSLAGRLVRRHERERDTLDRALAELAAAQASRVRTVAQAERNRIAGEMHDLVAHAVSEMVVQLGAARMGLLAEHLAVPDQLVAAEATGRQALSDLRRSLGVLPDQPGHALAPAPGIDAIPRLVSEFRDVGLEVRLDQDPGLHTLPAGLQLAVHRVLQESLTNALKHAGPVRVDVRLTRRDDTVALEVTSAPPRDTREVLPSGRHGLIGMRERVAVYDGDLVAGPTTDGGWQIRARWPVPDVAMADHEVPA